MELLKVKMAALHEGDVKQLKELYDLKLKHTLENLGRLDQENSKLREMLHLSNAEKYELKKKF
jgi:predicted nuclease with TOPRIM domain